MANGSDTNGSWFQGLPMWVKAVGVVGFPALVSLWLMYIVTVTLPTMASATNDQAHAINLLQDRISHHEADTGKIIPLLEKICRRLSKSDVERESCQ